MSMLKTKSINFRDFMDGSVGWGEEYGEEVYDRLFSLTLDNPNTNMFHLSMRGIRHIDFTFVESSIVKLSFQLSKLENRGLCITELNSPDIIRNIGAAHELSGESIVILKDESKPILVGVSPTLGLCTAYTFILKNHHASIDEYAANADEDFTNASVQLKRLFDAKFLFRFHVPSKNSSRPKWIYHAKY